MSVVLKSAFCFVLHIGKAYGRDREMANYDLLETALYDMSDECVCDQQICLSCLFLCIDRALPRQGHACSSKKII